MQTRTQYLLGRFAEECNEAAHQALKAQAFGVDNEFKGVPSAQLFSQECCDVLATMEMLVEAGALPKTLFAMRDRVERKKVKVEQFMSYAYSRGQVDEPGRRPWRVFK